MKSRVINQSSVVVLVAIGFIVSAQAYAAVVPAFDATNFVPGAPINNPYLPMVPNTLYTYRGEKEEGGEVEVELNKVLVTTETRDVMGIPTRVVRDTEWINGLLTEKTDDWYAQDKDGNVWYMGEFSTAYEYDSDDNLIGTNHDGSWEAGVDGALPGYIMKFLPGIGDNYYQEYYPGEAEDEATITSLTESVTIGYGSFSNVLKTYESTALEPDAREFKYYAPGLGLVLIEELDETFQTDFTSELIGVQTIPEPTSMALIIMGLSTLRLGMRRRLS